MKRPAQLSAHYNKSFYIGHADGSLRSARAIVPLVIELVQPRSVVDFGCGIGTWLQAFAESGVEDYVGFDGDYVHSSQLRIPADRFRVLDLRYPAPLGRRFDLAVCLEVGEHLPTTTSPILVQMLTESAPVVLFSAALPGQGGADHCNEQWTWYWEELFAKQGFVRLDAIRPKVWGNPDVEWWYQQNTLIYAQHARLIGQQKMRTEYGLTRDRPMELVSAYILRRTVSPSLWEVFGMLPGAAWRGLSRRISLNSVAKRAEN